MSINSHYEIQRYDLAKMMSSSLYRFRKDSVVITNKKTARAIGYICRNRGW